MTQKGKPPDLRINNQEVGHTVSLQFVGTESLSILHFKQSFEGSLASTQVYSENAVTAGQNEITKVGCKAILEIQTHPPPPTAA